MFRGTYTALVTPFQSDRVDEQAFRALIDAQIEGGVDGIVPVGTTGESATLSHEEHNRVIEVAVHQAAGRCKVIAGTGSNSTREAVETTQQAARLGADAALLVAPYYNKPSQEGLFQHFKAIASNTKLPLVLYSIPGRCGIEIGVETTRRLALECPTIVAIKEAGGSVDRVSALRAALPESFVILSGDAPLTLPFMSVGAEGLISVASNLLPREISTMVREFAAGRIPEARAIHARLYRLFKALFIEGNPAGIKEALALTGGPAPEMRLPLVRMSEAGIGQLRAVLAELDLLPK